MSIYDAEARSQSFGQVRNAYIRVLNQASGREIARDLSGDASTETAMVSASCTATAPTGSSGPSARATPPACARYRPGLRRHRLTPHSRPARLPCPGPALIQCRVWARERSPVASLRSVADNRSIPRAFTAHFLLPA